MPSPACVSVGKDSWICSRSVPHKGIESFLEKGSKRSPPPCPRLPRCLRLDVGVRCQLRDQRRIQAGRHHDRDDQGQPKHRAPPGQRFAKQHAKANRPSRLGKADLSAGSAHANVIRCPGMMSRRRTNGFVLRLGWLVPHLGLAGVACGRVASLDDFVLEDTRPDAGANTEAGADAAPEGGADVEDEGTCTGGNKDCNGQMPRVCSADGQWEDTSLCVDQACVAGGCVGVCAPGSKGCDGLTRQSCDANGQWQAAGSCTNQACVGGDCVGECAPGSTRCEADALQTCLASGAWGAGTACDDPMPICSAGRCVAESVGGPSCMGLPATCGPTHDANCCASAVVPGGTFNRGNIPSYPATVSDFRMDVYEVTVGRFRRFVDTFAGTQQNPPKEGDGANPHLPGSGWQVAWNTELALDMGSLKSDLKCYYSTGIPRNTWTDTVGEDENRPITCVTWYAAFAFCTWDGGRIPTEAEWNYAAAGGSEQRYYPWSVPPGNTSFDCTYAHYDGCHLTEVPEVGALSPKGDGRWGHANLGDGMWEWVLDWYAEPYVTPCDDCANLSVEWGRAHRGGTYYSDDLLLSTAYRDDMNPNGAVALGGVRCVRAP